MVETGVDDILSLPSPLCQGQWMCSFKDNPFQRLWLLYCASHQTLDLSRWFFIPSVYKEEVKQLMGVNSFYHFSIAKPVFTWWRMLSSCSSLYNLVFVFGLCTFDNT